MTELPKGWELTTVGELGEYINGRGFKKTEWSDSGRPIIRIQNLTGSGSSFNYFDGELEDRYVVPTGALLVSWAATLGVYRWDGPEGALNQHIFRVRSFINADFHRYLLEHALDLMQGHTHGSGMVHITRGRFDSTPAPLPPLAEQERIVAAIEEALSKLDAGEAGLRTVRQLLKRMRDAILAAAVTGRLVPQDPTDTPATKLLADLGIEPIEPDDVPELPDGWVRATVGDLLDRIEAGKSFVTLGRPAHDDEIGVVKVSAMTWGSFRPEENKAIPVDSAVDTRWVIRSGDLLFSRANTSEYVGACVLVPRDFPNLILSDKSLRLVPHRGVSPEWLLAYLRSRPARAQIEVLATGTKESMRNISQAKLRSVEVALPPEDEQVRIVGEVERQMSFVSSCERAIDAGLERSAALRRSVLKAAFEGQLVAQDPTDEPASVLLERIRAERAAAPKTKASRTRAKS